MGKFAIFLGYEVELKEFCFKKSKKKEAWPLPSQKILSSELTLWGVKK